MGGGGIEPPTPGFSIVVSDTPGTGASVESVDGSAMLSSKPKTSAQQIAQHERSTGAEDVEFPDVRKLSGNDPTLRLLVEVWSELPDSVQSQILRLADVSVADFNRD
tara:strand:+ start:131964 stop:132284 length:321 start_codon:yes stop_codon:yes gene_type:complete